MLLEINPWMTIFPGLVMFFTAIACEMILLSHQAYLFLEDTWLGT